MKTAIITGIFTIVGFVINALLNEFVDGYRFKREKETLENAKKQELYVDFLKNMQKCMNDSTKAAFTDFQHSINTILLYGSDSVIIAINKYYKKLASQNKIEMMTAQEHRDFQIEIINLMRKDLNKYSQNLRDIELIALRIDE